MIRHLAEKLWSASRKEARAAHTVVLKLKTSAFKILTRSHTSESSPSSCTQLIEIALKLRERVDLDPQQRYRLVGVFSTSDTQLWPEPQKVTLPSTATAMNLLRSVSLNRTTW